MSGQFVWDAARLYLDAAICGIGSIVSRRTRFREFQPQPFCGNVLTILVRHPELLVGYLTIVDRSRSCPFQDGSDLFKPD